MLLAASIRGGATIRVTGRMTIGAIATKTTGVQRPPATTRGSAATVTSMSWSVITGGTHATASLKTRATSCWTVSICRAAWSGKSSGIVNTPTS